MEHFEGIESYSVKHLPIVKAYADKLGLVELRRAMPATQNSDMTLSRLFCKIDGGIKHHPKTKEVTHEKTYRKVFRSRQG